MLICQKRTFKRSLLAESRADHMKEIFLTAHWKYLAMINYEVEPALLKPYLPKDVRLDFFAGRCFVSMVGFLFDQTRVKGIAIPFHQSFEEVNLRFYVRWDEKDEVKRGVVFITEIVPRGAIAWLAKTLYHENYVSMPMNHQWKFKNEIPFSVDYRWKYHQRWNSLSVTTQGEPFQPTPGSHEEFITEHYWGYVKLSQEKTTEYAVEHPPWKVWSAQESIFDCDVDKIYGKEFAPFLKTKPYSAFLAEGSSVVVRAGIKI